MYKVYGLTITRTSRVLWMLEELGVPYEFIKAAPHSDVITALNPSGKVPVMLVGTDMLTDSTAILTYLADRHQNLTFPAGSIERARQDTLLHQVLDEIDAVLWTAARHSFVLPEEHRVPEIKTSLKWEFARNLDLLADRFEGPFLMGEAITFADIILAHCLNWAISAKFPVENTILTDYARSMRARDAFKRVRALDAG